MPVYPYAAVLVARPTIRHRKLVRKAVVVFGFLVALTLASVLRMFAQ